LIQNEQQNEQQNEREIKNKKKEYIKFDFGPL
jgi:hypothetical protein